MNTFQWFGKQSLFRRLLIHFALVIFLPTVLISSIVYVQSSRSLETQVDHYLDQIVAEVNDQTDRLLQGYMMATLPLVANARIKHYLDIKPDQESDRIETTFDTYTLMDNLSVQYPEIERIYLLTNTGLPPIIYQAKSSPSAYQPYQSYEQLQAIVPDNGQVAIHAVQNKDAKQDVTVTIARKIRGTTSFTPSGIVAIDIRASDLASIWSNVHLGQHGFFMIVGSSGNVIYGSNGQTPVSQLTTADQSRLLSGSEGSFWGQWNGQPSLFHYHATGNTDWRLVAVVPQADVVQPIMGIRITAVLTGIAVFLIAFLLSIKFIGQIVRPIRLIQGTMKKVEQGQWVTVPDPAGHDEISSLVRSYNRMVERVSTLVDQVYYAELKNHQHQIELQQRQLEGQAIEFQALQSQINPHFLYNTLETVNAYAIIKEVDEISEMVEALAYMFRYSAQNQKLVAFVNELKHVGKYLLIQEHRLQKVISFDIDVDPALLLHEMVKLTLQPLVENAIQHGLKHGIMEGDILVRASIDDYYFLVSVADNGQGMNSERLAEVRSGLTQAGDLSRPEQVQKLGIGLSNVHRRIQLSFGEEYGLTIESKAGQGTTVTMRMPKGAGGGEGTSSSSDA